MKVVAPVIVDLGAIRTGSVVCVWMTELPASPSLQSVHRRLSASVSRQLAQHDNRTAKGDKPSAVSS